MLLLPLSAATFSLWLIAAPVLGLPRDCRFRLATGIQCPACGGVRAWQALAAGELTAAWKMQPGLILAAMAAAVFSLYSLWVVIGRRRRLRFSLRPFERVVLLILVVLALLANWLYLFWSATAGKG